MNNYTNFQTKRANFFLIFYDTLYYSTIIFSITFLLSFVLLNYNFLKIKYENFDKINFFSTQEWTKIYNNIDFRYPLILSIVIFIIFFIFIFKKFRSEPAKNKNNDEHVRGAKIADEKDLYNLNKDIVKSKKSYIFCFKLQNQNEKKYLNCFNFTDFRKIQQGFLILGKPGSGKTNLIRQMLAILRNNKNVNALIFDLKGNDYLPFFFDSKADFIFNPADSRTLIWNVFDEISNKTDIDTIVNCLIPDRATDQYWVDNARNVLYAIIYYLVKTKKNPENADILELAKNKSEELLNLFENANQDIQNESMLAFSALRAGEKTSPVILNYMNSRLRPLKNLKSIAEKGEKQFKIEDFLSNKGHKIFINAKKDVIESIKPIITLFITLFIKKILSRSENVPTFVFLDEFASLNAISELADLIDKGRSKNAIAILGLQGFERLKDIYQSDYLSEAINSYVGNRIYLSVEGQSAKKISENIGDREVLRTVESQNNSNSMEKGAQSGLNYSKTKQNVVEKAVLASEISNFKNLEGLLKEAGSNLIFHLFFAFVGDFKAITQDFILNKNFEIIKDMDKTENTVNVEKTQNKEDENKEKGNIELDLI
ncbi:MAG: type IV secretion system DNA-binding domain-containing protein [Deltaproteobacteria bacterium]|nr:type IV secretion system DNA-binding domain-containing protein [Deltaproteobacteria bacterium]